jgi:serine/threonine protein kinase
VALKTIRVPEHGTPAPNSLSLLREEARLLASVDHPHVVRVQALREAPESAPAWGRLFLVLQYVPGESLATRVRREGSLPWQLAARYAAEVGEGLLEVQRLGIVHRDVKPSNILWDTARDRAVLTDFGISARLAEAATIAGTPFYMPPEAFAGVVSPAHDVYGLAASLFWLVTGSVPFPALTPDQLIAQVERGLPDPEARCACLPRPLERLLRAGLAAEPRQRPRLADFVAALRGGLNQLLADSILLAPAPSRQAPVGLRLTVSRAAGSSVFIPVATTHPAPERLVRDVRRVPREPERVDVRTGERLRLEVEADRPGHLMVFNVGPTGTRIFSTRSKPGPLPGSRAGPCISWTSNSRRRWDGSASSRCGRGSRCRYDRMSY